MSSFNLSNFMLLFFGLPDLLLHFNLLLGRKVPKLLESYGSCFHHGMFLLLKPCPNFSFSYNLKSKSSINSTHVMIPLHLELC